MLEKILEYIVLIPLFCLLYTPYILITSFSKEKGYIQTVKSKYRDLVLKLLKDNLF